MKLYYDIWNIGFVEENIETIILSSKETIDVKWLNHPYHDRFFADPFILSISDHYIEVLVEEYPFCSKKGFISKLIIDKEYNLIKKECICEQNFHQSYPFIINKLDEVIVIPEASQSGSLFSYNFNDGDNSLENQVELINEPLLDSTFIHFNNYWWLFATKRGYTSNSELFIYYSESFGNSFIPHPMNPIKRDLSSARPAGNLVNLNDEIYRIVQVCADSYGEAVRIYKVDQLSLNDYKETFVKELNLNDNLYNRGFHTLNGFDNICVVDGLKRIYSPIMRLVYELKYLLHNEK